MSPIFPARLPADPVADDFDWPPPGDALTVHELGPDPWQPLQDASRDDFAARQRKPSWPRAGQHRESTQTIAGVLGVAAIVAALASWVVYATLSQPAALPVIHPPSPVATAVPATLSR
jgi:hypothetical protein